MPPHRSSRDVRQTARDRAEHVDRERARRAEREQSALGARERDRGDGRGADVRELAPGGPPVAGEQHIPGDVERVPGGRGDEAQLPDPGVERLTDEEQALVDRVLASGFKDDSQRKKSRQLKSLRDVGASNMAYMIVWPV